MCDVAAGRRTTKDQTLKVWRAMSGVGESRIALKAEPMVILGIAENDAAGGLQLLELFEPCSDERLAETPTLLVRPDGDRSEAVPAPLAAGHRHGRERD